MAGRVQQYAIHQWVSDHLAAIAGREERQDLGEHSA
jgi:hypothetical protein